MHMLVSSKLWDTAVFCGLVSVYTATEEGNSSQLHTLCICLYFIANMLAIYSV